MIFSFGRTKKWWRALGYRSALFKNKLLKLVRVEFKNEADLSKRIERTVEKKC
jgi:hypothetical protein